MTITEGGYYVREGTGEFDAQHPDIQRDLAHPQEPGCSFGFLRAQLWPRQFAIKVYECVLRNWAQHQQNKGECRVHSPLFCAHLEIDFLVVARLITLSGCHRFNKADHVNNGAGW